MANNSIKAAFERLWQHVVAQVSSSKTEALNEAKSYTDTKVADLVNSAPETLDTLGELATAFEENQDVVEALDTAISNKADKSDVTALSTLVGDVAVSEQIAEAIDEIPQSDWNQNDESAADYVKNRPFYTGDPVETFIVEETTITLEEGADPIGIINTSQPLEVGKEYIVTINNTKYNAICKKHNGMGMSYLGNLSIIGQGPDTEEPFFTAPMDSDTELGFIFASDVLEYTVSINTMAQEIHYLDSKYIKDMYYKEINEVEVLPQSSLLFGYSTFDDVLLPTPLIEGSSYTVNWNGIEYECVARTSKWGVCIENTDVPFYIETINDGDLYTYIETANTGSHTISIYNNTDSVEVLPETSVELNDYIVERSNELSEMLVEGSEYTVNWNGTEYKCIAYGDENEAYIGNTALGGDDSSESDEPFFILTYAPNNFSVIVPSEEGRHDIHITGKVKTVHKIDREYLSGLIGISGTGENSEIFNDYRNIASSDHSHAEGSNTTASGNHSHAEGGNTTASGNASHAEGSNTIASNNNSHAEGYNTTASGDSSHAEGYGSKISLSLTGNANSKTYTVGTHNDNIKVGRVLNYNNTYAMITSYNKSTLTITTDKTLSRTALSNTTVKLVLGIASGQYSHTEGYYTTASGNESHAEGYKTTASGKASHAEGYETTASSNHSHAEGSNTTASGNASHAEGASTLASGNNSHAEGGSTLAFGSYSHAEGNDTTASSQSSHAEGEHTIASGQSSHAEGYKTIASSTYSHAEGCGKKITLSLTGSANTATYTVSSNNSNIKVGRVLEYNNTYAKITNYDSSTKTITTYNTLDKTNALTNAKVNLVLGIASGDASHAEGYNTTASSDHSHTEGYYTTASGNESHAEGYKTTASGKASHAEGYETTASGDSSHAEGSNTTASGNASHAEGSNTIASNNNSHAEGASTLASGNASHAEGYKTTASCEFQHVQGKYNINDVDVDGNPLNTYAHIVGNGESEDARSNAHTLDWDGNAWFSGDVYVGSTSGTNRDEGSKKLASEEYVDTKVADLVNSAPETLDTLGELATAFAENQDVVTAISNKADKSDVTALSILVGDTAVSTQISEAIEVIPSDALLVSITTNDDGTYSSDKTFEEIKSHIENGGTAILYDVETGAFAQLLRMDEEGIAFIYTIVSSNSATATPLALVRPDVQQMIYWIYSDNTVQAIALNLSISDVELFDANTTDKTIVGAINELNAKHTEGTDSLILLSPNGTRFSITVGDDGVLSATEITE